MRARRIALIVVSVVAAGFTGVIAYDFFQFGRRVPSLAPQGDRASAIVVEKSARRMTLYRNDQPLKTYKIALGSDPVGPKQQEGDGKTPEGI